MSTHDKPNMGSATPAPFGMRAEIEKKWGRFTSAEISDLKNVDDLIAKVQSKYQIDKAQARADVNAFAKGRQL